MATWVNEDGLSVKFGTDRSVVKPGGVTSAEEKTLVYKVADATTLGDADTAATDGHDAFIPAGAHIKDAVLMVGTAFTSGGAAVLDIGTKQAAGTTIDDDGIDAAIAVAALTANTSIVADGALIGTTVAVDSYVTVTYDTAAFTAGDAVLVIKYVLA